MGLFDRVSRNLNRIFADAAPIVSAVAPFVVPGLGGLVISNLAARFIRPQATRSPAAVIRAGGPLIPPTCRQMGVLGGGFSAPWQARNFMSGGSFAGRPVATFGGRVPVGRDIRVRFCPSPPPQLPVVTVAPIGAAAVGTVQAQPVLPVKETVSLQTVGTPTEQIRAGLFQPVGREAIGAEINSLPGTFSRFN